MNLPKHTFHHESLDVSDPMYAPILRSVILGRAFAFLPASSWEKPPLVLVREHLKGETFTDRVWPLFAPRGATVFQTQIHPEPIGAFRLCVLFCDRATCRPGEDVRLSVLDPSRARHTSTISIEDAHGTRVDQIPVELDRAGCASIAWRSAEEGTYTASLDHTTARATFRVDRAPHLISPVDPAPTAEVPLATLGGFGALCEDPETPLGWVQSAPEPTTAPFSVQRNGPHSAALHLHTTTHLLCVTCLDPSIERGFYASDAPHPSHEDSAYRRAEDLFQRGHARKARKELMRARSRIIQEKAPHPYYAYYIACCYAQEDNADRAIDWLRTALRDGFSDFEHLKADPDLQSLQGHPTFPFLCGGGSVSIPAVYPSQDAPISLPISNPACVVYVGAWIDGAPWEGYGLLLKEDSPDLSIKVPSHVAFGEDITVRCKAKNHTAARLVISTQRPAQTSANRQLTQHMTHFARHLSPHPERPSLTLAGLVQDPQHQRPQLHPAPPYQAVQQDERAWSHEATLSLVDGRASYSCPAPEHETDLFVEVFALHREGWSTAQSLAHVRDDAWIHIDAPTHMSPRDSVVGHVHMRVPSSGASLSFSLGTSAVTSLDRSDQDPDSAQFAEGLHQCPFMAQPGTYTAQLHSPNGDLLAQARLCVAPLGSKPLHHTRAFLLGPGDVLPLDKHPLTNPRASSSVYPFLRPFLQHATSPIDTSCLSISLSALASLFWIEHDPNALSSLSLSLRRLQALWDPEQGLRADLKREEVAPQDLALRAARILRWIQPPTQTALTSPYASSSMDMLCTLARAIAEHYDVCAVRDDLSSPEATHWTVHSEPPEERNVRAIQAAYSFLDHPNHATFAARLQTATTLLFSKEPKDLRVAFALLNSVFAEFPAPHPTVSVDDLSAFLIALHELEGLSVFGGQLEGQRGGVWAAHQAWDRGLQAVRCVDHAMLILSDETEEPEMVEDVQRRSLRVALEVEAGRATRCLHVADRVSLVVEFLDGGRLGDVLCVELPSALQSERDPSTSDTICISTHGRDRIEIPLVAHHPTLGADDTPVNQHFFVGVRNVVERDREVHVGPLAVVVFAQEGEVAESDAQGAWSVQARALPKSDPPAQSEEGDSSGLLSKTLGAFKKLFD